MEQQAFKVKLQQNTTHISYDENIDLDINQAVFLKSELQKTLENTASIQLDISKIDLITTPSIQVILAAAIDSKKSGKAFTVLMSQNTKSKFQLLGLDKTINEWTE